jgi:hypothetical protein
LRIQAFAFFTVAVGGALLLSAPGDAQDTLQRDIEAQNRQLQENLQGQQEDMRDSKFYSGKHEGLHWDPVHGWHRQLHDGPYVPAEVTVRE